MPEIDEGSMQIALALFRALIDYGIEYDEEAFRAAIAAYLIASELIDAPV